MDAEQCLPSVVWHLYDYFLHPSGGYFGAKKACEPLHVQYSYADRSVVVVNNLYHSVPGLNVIAVLYDSDVRQRFFHQAAVNSPEDSVQRAMVIPEISPAPKISFLKLTLEDRSGNLLSSNFYWLPAKLSVFDWDLARTNQHAYYSAVSAYEDLTMLNHLPTARLQASATLQTGREDTVRIHLQNPTSSLAFMVKLGICDNRGDEILPVLWEDNYLSLLPAESRVVVARYPAQKLGAHAKLEVEGWNVGRMIVPVAQLDTGIRK